MSRRLLDKLPKMLKDPEFAAAWEEAREEFSIAREVIRARTAAGLSQQELAERLQTTQSVIARLESGAHAPSVSTLRRVAKATHSRLRIELVPATLSMPMLYAANPVEFDGVSVQPGNIAMASTKLNIAQRGILQKYATVLGRQTP